MRFIFVIPFVVACSSSGGTPTGASCPSNVAPLTYDSFGKQFMTTYCTGCHASDRRGGDRHDAPADDNFDTLPGIEAAAAEIDGVAGAGPHASNTDMPPQECTSCKFPTISERQQLASWIACERGSGN